MYERLLLTHDGSDLADAAVPHAAALARAAGSEVLVLRVSRAAGRAASSLESGDWGRVIERAEEDIPEDERAEAYPPLSETVAALRAAGVGRAGSLVVRGDAGESIVDAAQRLECGAIAMSTHGLSGIRRAVLGSVADYVIRHSRGVPVLLCPPSDVAFEGMYRKVLIALDGSDLADALVPHAAQVAAGAGTEVVLLRVTDSPFRILTMTTPAGYPVPATLTPETAEEAVQAQREVAQEYLDGVAERLRAAGVSSVTPSIVEGDPGAAIVEAVEQLECDLVLLATHGRGGLGRALLGSVTDYVTRNLPRGAALVVPPAEDER